MIMLGIQTLPNNRNKTIIIISAGLILLFSSSLSLPPPHSLALLFVCNDLVSEDSERKGFVAVEEDRAVVEVELWHDESLVGRLHTCCNNKKQSVHVLTQRGPLTHRQSERAALKV